MTWRRLKQRLEGRVKVEFILPRGSRWEITLWSGDRVDLSGPGDPEPFASVERTGFGKVRVTLRADDERLTADDLDFLKARVRD